MPKVWAGVVRVSHMGKRRSGEANVHADADQIADVERYAAQHGATIVFMPPELDVSGGDPLEKRPALLAAIEGCERGKFDGIVVAYLSRLTRSRSGIEIWDRVEAVGGHVHCALENLDTSTASGRFVRDIHLANAVREREERGEGFERRREAATAAGIWQRRQTPLGYDRHPETRRLVPNADAPKVRWAFNSVGGVAIKDIALRLNMSPGGVRWLLRNRVYLGELRVGKHVNPVAHPALIGIETFDAAQRPRPRPGRKHNRAPALLAGLARCASCGRAMTRKRSAGATSTYTCYGFHSGGRCPRVAAITEQALDDHVATVALQELARLRVAVAEDGGSVADAREAVVAAERELAAYLDAVSAADVGPEAFRAGAQRRQVAISDAREAMHAALAVGAVPPEFLSGADAWEQLDLHGRNSLLRALLEAVVVFPVGKGARVPPAERVQVLRLGAGLATVRHAGATPAGLAPIARLDIDDERVLRVEPTE